MMVLPKGALKPLARVVGPLSLWMAAGWAAYPAMITEITLQMDGTIDTAEVEIFSKFMVAACAIIGIGLIVYGFIGRQPDDAEFKSIDNSAQRCRFCGAALEQSGKCPGCGSIIAAESGESEN